MSISMQADPPGQVNINTHSRNDDVSDSIKVTGMCKEVDALVFEKALKESESRFASHSDGLPAAWHPRWGRSRWLAATQIAARMCVTRSALTQRSTADVFRKISGHSPGVPMPRSGLGRFVGWCCTWRSRSGSFRPLLKDVGGLGLYIFTRSLKCLRVIGFLSRF